MCRGGFLEVFSLFFGQFSVNLSDDFFIRFLARFLSRFLARVLTRVLTRVLGRGKIINKAYSTTRPKEKYIKSRKHRKQKH